MKDQDSATIIVTSLLLLPWLGRAAVSTVVACTEAQSKKEKDS
jgi:hypothetical protein